MTSAGRAGPPARPGVGRDRRPALRPSRSLTCPLPHSISSPARARRLTRCLLNRWGLNGDYAARAEVVVSELVTDAICYALPDIGITWQMFSRDGRVVVRVEVTDGGPAGAAARCSDRPAAERGRDSQVMDALSCAHGTGQCGEGRFMRWAEIAPL